MLIMLMVRVRVVSIWNQTAQTTLRRMQLSTSNQNSISISNNQTKAKAKKKAKKKKRNDRIQLPSNQPPNQARNSYQRKVPAYQHLLPATCQHPQIYNVQQLQEQSKNTP
mmetsp:Transcript_18976/g.32874  ORF Transcript_18976/g.32874 Transcript_18976/m.32874 type:complete len:110 (+) Transcript_18976:261-590(+)